MFAKHAIIDFLLTWAFARRKLSPNDVQTNSFGERVLKEQPHTQRCPVCLRLLRSLHPKKFPVSRKLSESKNDFAFVAHIAIQVGSSVGISTCQH